MFGWLNLCAGKLNGKNGGILNKFTDVELQTTHMCCDPTRLRSMDTSSRCTGLQVFFSLSFLPLSRDATRLNSRKWTYKYCTVLNKMLWSDPWACARSVTVIGNRRSLFVLSCSVIGGWQHNVTIVQDGRYLLKTTTLSTHRSHSDTQLSP